MTGFINIDKQSGVSSAREVAIIKKLTGVPCGHMGTLDPMASGVLPVAVGNAARLFDYFLSKRKVYIAEFTFGINTDTLDTCGKVLESGKPVPKESDIESVLCEFCGDISQIPPQYSAKCVNGERGYNLARRGVSFTLAPKTVNVGRFEYLGKTKENAFSFCIECSSGTYIRSLARDLGARLQTVAVMSALTRTQSGVFKIENAVKSDLLNKDNVLNYLIPPDSVLPFESYTLTAAEQKKYVNGVPFSTHLKSGDYKIYLSDGLFYGVGQSDGTTLKSRIKLC